MSTVPDKPSGKPTDLPVLFTTVIAAHVRNLLRAEEARATHWSVACAVLRIAAATEVPAQPGRPAAVAELSAIRLGEYESWSYVSTVSSLVYYATLFDTYLQDVIEFLLFTHPGAMDDYELPFRRVLDATSRHDILNTAVKSKVRELGFLSFTERLRWLRQRYKLDIQLDKAELERLARVADLRNVVVHDQGWLDFHLTEDGVLALGAKACPRQPTHVGTKDIHDAAEVLGHTAAAIAEAVFGQVLKAKPAPAVQHLIDVLRDPVPRSSSPNQRFERTQ